MNLYQELTKNMNHIGLAHYFWKKHLKRGDTAVDATCGGGNDTLILAETCLGNNEGAVYGVDIQKAAIEATDSLLEDRLPAAQYDRVTLLHASHAPLPSEILKADLIVYNLGYLPGSDRAIKTLSSTSIKSLESALDRLSERGMVSIMLYPGHHEGLFEAHTILNWTSALPKELYSLSHHYRPNQAKSPSLLIIQKKKI